jgi:hypothetical protein
MGFSNRSLRRDLITLWRIQGDLQETASTTGIEAAEGYLRELWIGRKSSLPDMVLRGFS